MVDTRYQGEPAEIDTGQVDGRRQAGEEVEGTECVALGLHRDSIGLVHSASQRDGAQTRDRRAG